MKARATHLLTRLLALLLTVSFTLAQENVAMAQDRPAFTQQELDQMLAPIALYPDALLSQIMMAATYPLEVVEAERWSRANSGISGERAVRAVERNNWDPSVKSMVAFPQILAMMSDKIDWTERLGDAFLDQESQVMDTVQDLRHRAYAAGNLRSNDNYRVDSQGNYIDIEQADPEFAYVPYYNPNVVYGPWWWSQYPPVYWAPWPGYRERPGFGAGFAWGVGITLGAEFFFGAFDWPQRHVNVVNVNNYYYPRNTGVAYRASNSWQHEPEHRRGIPYRAPAVREKFSPARAAPEARRDYRGREPAASTQPGRNDNRPDAGAGARPQDRTGARPADVAAPARPEARDSRASRPEEPVSPKAAAAAPAARPEARTERADPRVAPGAVARPTVEPPPHALESVGRGTEARQASERGRASSAPPPRSPERSAAPAPSQRVAAPPPPQRAAAPAPSQRTGAPPPRESGRENKGKGQNEK